MNENFQNLEDIWIFKIMNFIGNQTNSTERDPHQDT